ncbi:hypothetical protein KJ644_02130 [Candidatus Dependentiae bacterium]|nr:hypothetical protein [Candidatus Dependentiae bacterium]MBU4387251.1 hypothetical protein [Candidatus Dependentiae bacterium]MCG2756546.1 hypothetical protein [Candidatus Dependentiae bacterium]
MNKYMKMTFLLLLAMSANSVSNAGLIDWSKDKTSKAYSWVQNHPKTILIKNKANNAYSWVKDHKKTIAFTATALALAVASYYLYKGYNNYLIEKEFNTEFNTELNAKFGPFMPIIDKMKNYLKHYFNFDGTEDSYKITPDEYNLYCDDGEQNNTWKEMQKWLTSFAKNKNLTAKNYYKFSHAISNLSGTLMDTCRAAREYNVIIRD